MFSQIRKIVSGSLLVAGTTVGAGMLGIPLLTAQAGFWPAMVVTLSTWAIMLLTGLLFLEATLWMPAGSNLLSMAGHFLGRRGRLLSGLMFLFLYYCLLVAYFAAGAPLLSIPFTHFLGVSLSPAGMYLLFGGIFMGIIGLGAKWIDRTNILLSVGMILTYFLVVSVGASAVNPAYLKQSHWNTMFFALPVLFSAFGYHNVIPSLCGYFKKEKKTLQLSIVLGTTLALGIYLVWQWLVIGMISEEKMLLALKEGKPVTAAMQTVTGNPLIFTLGQAFAFFALVTSLLGVSFSMVDFLADGLKVRAVHFNRWILVFTTFFPPFLIVMLDPTLFDKALGVAGGFGEALLNGFIPIALVWVGRYRKGLKPHQGTFLSSKFMLIFLFLLIALVMGIEAYQLLNHIT